MAAERRPRALSREQLLAEVLGKIEAVRKESEVNWQRILTIISGDPSVIDPDSPHHYSNSVIGRSDTTTRQLKDVEKGIKMIHDANKERFEDIERRLKEDSFTWTRTLDWVRRHWWKILLFLLVALLERQAIMDHVRSWSLGG